MRWRKYLARWSGEACIVSLGAWIPGPAIIPIGDPRLLRSHTFGLLDDPYHGYKAAETRDEKVRRNAQQR